MRPQPLWLDRLVVESFHHALVQQHGGALGIRDIHGLEAALAGPRQRWNFEPEVDRLVLAAMLCQSLACNHPFVDGTKRTAFTAMAVFLELNDLEVNAPEVEVVGVMLSVASGTMSDDQLAAWLRMYTTPLEHL
jgi:death on curing protein